MTQTIISTPISAVERAKLAKAAATKSAKSADLKAIVAKQHEYASRVFGPLLDKWADELEKEYSKFEYDFFMRIATLCGNGEHTRKVGEVDRRLVAMRSNDKVSVAHEYTRQQAYDIVRRLYGKKPCSVNFRTNGVKLLDKAVNEGKIGAWSYVEA
jgi:hypothetical protein